MNELENQIEKLSYKEAKKKKIINRKYENMNADLSEMKDTECVNIQVTEGPLSAKQERSTLIQTHTEM